MDIVNSHMNRGRVLTVAVLSIVLAMAFSTVASSDEMDGTETSGTCGPYLTWTIEEQTTESGKETVLIISGNGKMYDFDEESVPWAKSKDKITIIVLSDEVSTIGSYAFYNMSKVSGEFSINSRISSIGDHALEKCKYQKFTVIDGNADFKSDNGILCDYGLTTIIQVPAGMTGAYTIPATVTKIGPNAFTGCDAITSLNVSSNASDISSTAFEGLVAASIVFGNNFKNPDKENAFGLRFYYKVDVTTTAETLDLAGHQFNYSNFQMIKAKNDPAQYTVKYSNCSSPDPENPVKEIVGMPIVLASEASPEEGKGPWTFAGWLNGETIYKTFIGKEAKEYEMTAQWVVTVTFDSRGGSEVDPITTEINGSITKPSDPTIDKLKFEKWVDADNKDAKWDELTKNVTYYAVWKVEVLFDANGGKVILEDGKTADTLSRLILKDETVGALPNATKDGFKLLGWFTDPKEGEKIKPTDKYTESIRVYAHWETIGDCLISFVCQTKDGIELHKWEKTVQGGDVITTPSENTFTSKSITYYVEGWNGFKEGMIATGNMTFTGIYMKAINIKDPIEGKSVSYIADGDAIYILASTFKQLKDVSNNDPEFTFTITFNNGSMTLDSTFLKPLKPVDIKVAIYKKNIDDVPIEVQKKAGAESEIFTIVFGNEYSLTNQLTISLNYSLEGKVKERLTISSIKEDGTVETLSGYPSNTDITFKTKTLDYFAVKYDITNNLITFMNEDKLFEYYLIEKGKEIPAPVTVPTKDPTAQYKYTFVEWSNYTPGMKSFVYNQSFLAVYKTELRTYTIKFICEAQGKTVEVENKQLAYGEKVTAPLTKSVLIGGTTYEIASWHGLTSETVVNGDMTFRAELKETTSTSWIYIVICAAAVLVIVETLYMYNKRFRD